jgi:hypothetical protein
MLLLLFMSVQPQTLLAFMSGYFMSLSFLTTRHVGRCFLMDYCSVRLNGLLKRKCAKKKQALTLSTLVLDNGYTTAAMVLLTLLFMMLNLTFTCVVTNLILFSEFPL